MARLWARVHVRWCLWLSWCFEFFFGDEGNQRETAIFSRFCFRTGGSSRDGSLLQQWFWFWLHSGCVDLFCTCLEFMIVITILSWIHDCDHGHADGIGCWSFDFSFYVGRSLLQLEREGSVTFVWRQRYCGGCSRFQLLLQVSYEYELLQICTQDVPSWIRIAWRCRRPSCHNVVDKATC